MGLGLYIIANVYTWASNDAIIKQTVKCKYCRKRIGEKVSLWLSTLDSPGRANILWGFRHKDVSIVRAGRMGERIVLEGRGEECARVA